MFCTTGPGCGCGCCSPIPYRNRDSTAQSRTHTAAQPPLAPSLLSISARNCKKPPVPRADGPFLWLVATCARAFRAFVHRNTRGCSHSAFSAPLHPGEGRQNPSRFPYLFQNRNFQKELFSIFIYIIFFSCSKS